MQHDLIDRTGQPQILESILPKQRPEKLGQPTVPPSLSRGPSDLTTAFRRQGPSASHGALWSAKPAQGDSVLVLQHVADHDVRFPRAFKHSAVFHEDQQGLLRASDSLGRGARISSPGFEAVAGRISGTE